METETLIRIGLVVTGLLVLVFMNVDFSYLMSKLVFKKTTVDEEKDFLTMVNLWYKLKTMCDKNNVEKASKKLDEVFPLLNDGETNE